MPEIVLKDATDLEKVLGEMNQRVNGVEEKFSKLNDADAQHDELKTGLKDLRGVVDELARKRIPVAREDRRTPIDPEEFKNSGLEAVLKARTPVEIRGDVYSDPDGPVAEFQDASDALYCYQILTGKQGAQLRQSNVYRKLYKPALERVNTYLKDALDTADSGQGSDWIPNEFSSRLYEKVRLEMRVASLFENIAMPRSPYNLPVWLNDATAYYFTEATAAPVAAGTWSAAEKLQDAAGTTSLTGKLTFTAKALGSVMFASRFLEEDSIVAIQSFMGRAMAQAIANGIETAIINGDVTGTHMDNDIEAIAGHAASAWDGLRHAAIAASNNKDAGGAYIDSLAEFTSYVMAARGLMGAYGVRPNDLALIVSPVGFNQLLGIDAFATAASLVPGQGTNVQGTFNFRPFGMELIVSEFMKDNLAATGVNTAGGPNTFTGMVIVHKPSWKLGSVRQVTLQPLRELFALYDQTAVAATWRGDFQCLYGGASDAQAYVYDVALTG